MDRTLIAIVTMLDGSGAAPFSGGVLVVIMKGGRLHTAPATA